MKTVMFTVILGFALTSQAMPASGTGLTRRGLSHVIEDIQASDAMVLAKNGLVEMLNGDKGAGDVVAAEEGDAAAEGEAAAEQEKGAGEEEAAADAEAASMYLLLNQQVQFSHFIPDEVQLEGEFDVAVELEGVRFILWLFPLPHLTFRRREMSNKMFSLPRA